MGKIAKDSGSKVAKVRTLGPIVARFESFSREGAFYTIREASDGSHFYCDCPAWRFQKGKSPENRVCKHLTAFDADRGSKRAAKALPKAAVKALKA